MANLINYIREYRYRFNEQPFTKVDALVLAWFSYFHFEAVPELRDGGSMRIGDLWKSEYFDEMIGQLNYSDERLTMLGALTASPRYRDAEIFGYVTELDGGDVGDDGIQFSAVSFRLSDKLITIAYRGTDGTFIGWKEDCKLALKESIPAQVHARDYVERIAAGHPEKLVICGHSKGGNLASYAAAMCPEEVQEKILRVYSFDGPGFKEADLALDGFIRMKDKMVKFMPQTSVVGVLFNQEGTTHIVESDASGLQQHNPFTWLVAGKDFRYRDALTAEAKLVLHNVNRWLNDMEEDEMSRFIDALFEVLENTGSEDMDGVFENKKLLALVKSAADTDKEHMSDLLHAMAVLLVPDSVSEAVSDRVHAVMDVLHDRAVDVKHVVTVVKDKVQRHPEGEEETADGEQTEGEPAEEQMDGGEPQAENSGETAEAAGKTLQSEQPADAAVENAQESIEPKRELQADA